MRQVSPIWAALVASVAVCFAIAVYDTWMAFVRAPQVPTWSLPFAAFGLAAVAILPMTILFTGARSWASHDKTKRLLVSTVESLAFGLPVFLFEKWDSLSSTLLYSAVCAFCFGKLMFALFPRARWVRDAVKLTMIGACVFALLWLPWRQKPLFRFVAEVNVAILTAGLAAPHIRRLNGRVVHAVVALAVAFAAFGLLLFWQKPRLPIAILNATTQSQAAATLLFEHCSICVNARRARLGPVVCTTKPSTCHARDDSKPTQLSGRAKGADVLLLSLDSLRGDYVGLLEPLVEPMGGVVQFSNAFAPAPGTRLTFGSLWRGRNVRRVAFSDEVLHGGVVQNGAATLASAVTSRGYRAVHIPTHRFFNPAAGLTAGFELSYADRQAPLNAQQVDLEQVPYADALRHALEIARQTTGPLLIWSHAMESHYPYGGKAFRQAQDPQGHRASIAYLVHQIGKFLPEFRAIRKNRPLIVAIFGDHGEEFGEHGGQHHSSTVHVEQVHVTWLLAGPALASHKIIPPVSLSAMPATILDWLGAPIPCDFDLPSVLGCIEDSTKCPEVVESSTTRFGGVFGYTVENVRVIAQGRSNVNSLYELATDPSEQDDRFDRDDFPMHRLNRVRQLIRAFDRKYCVKAEKVSGGD